MEFQQDIKEKSVVAVSNAKALVISTKEDYELGGNHILGLKALEKQIDNWFDPIRLKAHASWKEVVATQKNLKEPSIQARTLISSKMGIWRQEEERKRRAEEERLNKIAEAQAEEERLARALEAEQQGDQEEAEEILEQPVYVPPVVLTKTVPKIKNLVIRKNYSFRIKDQTKIPQTYMKPDEVKIRQLARSLKEDAQLPGVEFYCFES